MQNAYNSKNNPQKTKKSGALDINALKQAVQSGNMDDFINKNLDSASAQKLKSVLADKAATEKLMATPQAKELMKKFTEGK